MDPSNFDPDLVSEMLSAMGKELKLARAKIKSLESQDYKERAESAEYALEVMRKNFEDIHAENRQLRTTLEELRDSKVWIKKEKTEEADQTIPLPPKDYSEKSTATEPDIDTNHVQNLEQALETYYRKYKSQRESKNQLRETCRELEDNLLKVAAELNEQKLSKDKEMASKVLTGVQSSKPLTLSPSSTNVTSRQHVYTFMSSLPSVSTPFQGQKRKPVCNISMDLKAFLAEDPRSKDVGTNLLCLPGRVIWCPPTKQHALAVAPQYIYKLPKQTLSENKAAFNGLYGQTFHLFYSWHESIYYAGLYKAIDLREKTPEGFSISGFDLSWKAMAEATLRGICSPKINRVLATLYQEGALKAEVLGLQCIDCDIKICDMLTSRFASIQSAMNPVGKRGGYYPEAMQEEEPKKKKQKIVF